MPNQPEWSGAITLEDLTSYMNGEVKGDKLNYIKLAQALAPHMKKGMTAKRLAEHSEAGKIHAHYVLILAAHYGINRAKALEWFGFIDATEVMEMAEDEKRRLGFNHAPAEGRYTTATQSGEFDAIPSPN